MRYKEEKQEIRDRKQENRMRYVGVVTCATRFFCFKPFQLKEDPSIPNT